jgi:site-specific recombinase XerD
VYQYFSYEFTTSSQQLFCSNQSNKPEKNPTLIQSFNFHIASIERLEGTEFAHNTVRKYKSVLNSIKRYLKGADIALPDLDYSFVSNYYSYLVSKEGLKNNSALKNLKCLYRVIHICILNKWISSNPFTEFKCAYKQPIRPYLTEAEIEQLYSTAFSSSKLRKVRDLFILQIYSGLAYADMQSLSKTNIEVGVDGKQWIVLNRLKTGQRSAIPILPRALEVLQRYNYELPICSNQKMNDYLKEIATACNINKCLTSHIGRHTFATTVTLSKGVPIETVSRMLGHCDLKTTQIYAKVTDQKVSNDMDRLFI